LFEEIPGVGFGCVLYEGRHRGVGAYLAEREYILGRQIGKEHSTVISQNTPSNTKYFNKPIYTLSDFSEKFRHDPQV
jgi:hypothetical protein